MNIQYSPYAGYFLIVVAALMAGCTKAPDSDAFGNFEATEITVSAQAEGRLLEFSVNEGDQLEAGDIIGLIDTTQLVAQFDNLSAQQRNVRAQQVSLQAQEQAARAQIDEALARADVWEAQLRTATHERDRTVRLASSQAATERELNERDGLVEQLEAQKRQSLAGVQTARAQADVYAAQANALTAQIESIEAQMRQVQDRLDNAHVANTRSGTVLSVLSRAGEVVRMGTPLFTIADLDPLILKAYATGNQLPDLQLGMAVDVLIDDGTGGLEVRPGTVSFIAARAEFTPTPIQTRNERAELVYAFEVRTPNGDGRLKIGMPGEVRFQQ